MESLLNESFEIEKSLDRESSLIAYGTMIQKGHEIKDIDKQVKRMVVGILLDPDLNVETYIMSRIYVSHEDAMDIASGEDDELDDNWRKWFGLDRSKPESYQHIVKRASISYPEYAEWLEKAKLSAAKADSYDPHYSSDMKLISSDRYISTWTKEELVRVMEKPRKRSILKRIQECESLKELEQSLNDQLLSELITGFMAYPHKCWNYILMRLVTSHLDCIQTLDSNSDVKVLDEMELLGEKKKAVKRIRKLLAKSRILANFL